MLVRVALVLAWALWLGTAHAATLASAELAPRLQSLTGSFPGRVGICVQDSAGATCQRAGERFPMQSVMKLVVAAAALDAVDRGVWTMDDSILVRREDLSVFVQPLARLVGPDGYSSTVRDLARRAVVDSDSAAADILLARLGGTETVRQFLAARQLQGIRVDRDERHLQTEILGLSWQPEFVDPDKLRMAIRAVPDAVRDSRFRAYQKDVRDTATPAAMAALQTALAEDRLLSPAMSRELREMQEGTVTFPDRLQAGAPAGWKVGHKTGTSGTWHGVTAATNDVGLLTGPDGHRIAIAVFIADSTATDEVRAKLIADVAAAAAASYR
jgi:beta-lactamase class A